MLLYLQKQRKRSKRLRIDFSIGISFKKIESLSRNNKLKVGISMKKSVLTMVAAFCLAASAFAAGNQPTNAKWEGNINVYRLGRYLNLTSEQSQEVENICDYFTEQMIRATNSKKDKDEKLRNAVYGNLKLMKQTLTAEQYSKYATLLNVTLNNKGIEVK